MMGMVWGPRGPCGYKEITKNAITFERIEIIEFEGVYPPVYSEYVEGSQSLHMLMCVWGNVCSLRVRGLSRRRH